MIITKVEYLERYKLLVFFEDGKSVIADFESFILNSLQPMTNQFKSLTRFQKVKIVHGHLDWEEGQMDIDAESIYNGEFSLNVTSNI